MLGTMQEVANASSTQHQTVIYANHVLTNDARANISQINSSNTVRANVLASSHSEQSNDSLLLSDTICMFRKKPLGKQAHVYEGQYTNGVFGNQKIAVKFIPYDKRNVEEAKALLKLTPHKHVVALIHSDVYDIGPIKYMFIAMEMCHTENLYEHITTQSTYRPKFNSKLKFTWTSQLVEGMAHIHYNKIIHRDLKPHNVLFSYDKKLIKIADFGLSKQMRSGRSVTNQSTLRVGTDGYRAPETYNRDVISPQADIFSLGLVIYFVWSDGKHPFGVEPELWNYNIKSNKNPCLDGLKILEEGLAQILFRWMLRFEPKERPTASDLKKHDLLVTMADPANLQIQWLEEVIIVKWDAVLGTKLYNIRVMNTASNEVVHTGIVAGQTEYQFAMSPSCGYGLSCCFTVEAVGITGHHTESSKTTLIAMADPANIQIQCQGEVLIVRWDPVAGTKFYKVRVMNTLTPSNNLAHFGTAEGQRCEYRCVMSPSFGYGLRCCVTVQAVGLTGQKTESTETVFIAMADPANIHIQWRGEEVIVKWDAVPGAKCYNIQVMDIVSNKLAHMGTVAEQTEYRFEMSPSCGYGLRCCFTVEAVGITGCHTKSSKTSLIGGDFVATNAKAHNDPESPCNCLIVTWQPPVMETQRYRISLKELGNIKCQEKMTEMTHAQFTGLKPNTHYCCVVHPVNDGHCFPGTSTDVVQTAPRNNLTHQTLELAVGNPVAMWHTVKRIGNKNSVALEWSQVDVGLDYHVLERTVELKRHALFFDMPVCNKFEYACDPDDHKIEFENLEQGWWYSANLATKLKDLRSNEVHEFSKLYEFKLVACKVA